MKYLGFVTVFFVVFITSFPLVARALTKGIPFAGYVTTTIPCTCSGGALLVFGKGLYTGFRVPVPNAALLYQLGVSRPYANFNAGTPFTWNLGAYTPAPGIQTACLVGVPPACVPTLIPVVGVGTIQYIGTSRPALGVFGL